jgi:fumarylacetoacetase
MTKSWLTIPSNSPFSVANIPFGIITTLNSSTPRPAIAIGDHALDLSAFAAADGFCRLLSIHSHLHVFSQSTLNDFAALGRQKHSEVRKYLQSVFDADTPYPEILQTNNTLQDVALVPLSEVKPHLPMKIGDYTDFYAGLNHAYNVGVLFRGPDNALQPNYMHLPVGYHGRASSVVVSGTPIRRPRGQMLPQPGAKEPAFSPCKRLDIELELAAFVCKANNMGEPIPIASAEDYIFGYVLMNDWSARDIQAWEYVPLGPFNSKNFATTISPWVVLPEALEPFRTRSLRHRPQHTMTPAAEFPDVLPYLKEPRDDTVYDIELTVTLKPSSTAKASTISRTNASNLLYSPPQMLTHHTSTGCPMNVGDLLGSGTISGTEPGTLGSLLEQTKGGKELVKLEGGEERRFLEDGDEVVMSGVAGKGGEFVGFGECRGVIMPALGG